MDDRDKIVQELLSELESKEPVGAFFSTNVISQIERVKEIKEQQRASIRYWGTILAVSVVFLAMVYLVVFVLFDASIAFNKETLSQLINFSVMDKLVNIWQSGGHMWSMVGGSTLFLLLLQQFLSKKLDHYKDTNSMSSSENSRLNA